MNLVAVIIASAEKGGVVPKSDYPLAHIVIIVVFWRKVKGFWRFLGVYMRNYLTNLTRF